MDNTKLKGALACALSAACVFNAFPAIASEAGSTADYKNFSLTDEDGKVTFLAGTDMDITITDKDQAKAVLDDVKEELGGSPESELVFESMLDAGQIDIYNFVQEIQGQVVANAVAKAIVGKDGQLFAISSSLSDASPQAFGESISGEEAEQIVLEALGENSDLDILEGETHEMLLPVDVITLATYGDDREDGETSDIEGETEEEAGAEDAAETEEAAGAEDAAETGETAGAEDAGETEEAVEEISDEEAEAIAEALAEELANESGEDAADAEEEDSQPEIGDMISVWAVYTNNDSTNPDSRPYLVHYVAKDGEYLYALPVFEPQSWEAKNAVDHSEIYSGKTEESYTVTVTDHDGSTREITIPVMKDEEGTIYLCSLENKMVMADYYDFHWAPGDDEATDKDITILTNKDQDFPNEALLTYDYFKKIRDFYMEQGWEGADGVGTDCLLLYNYCGSDHTPEENCVYLGMRTSGWQAFAFSDGFDFGYCPDVMAHEFTHCISHSTMIYSPYYNDYGAINEAMSDVIGKIVEQLAIGETEGPWVMGNDVKPARNMADPHELDQPQYVWDVNYIPNTVSPAMANDLGGVHVNSSFMNYAAWKLHEAGMPLMDELNYWLAVNCCLSAKTDYPQLASMLPWVLSTIGYDEYLPVLNEAIEVTRMAEKGLPEEMPEGCGMVNIPIPDDDTFWNEDFRVTIYNVETETGMSHYPSAEYESILTALPEGVYIAMIQYVNEDGELTVLDYTPDGWINDDEVNAPDTAFTVTENEVTELNNINFENITLAPHEIFEAVMNGQTE